MVQRILAAVGRRRAGDDNWCRHLRGRRPQSAMTPVDNSLGSLARIGMTEPRQPRRSPGYAGGMGHAVTLRSARRTAALRADITRADITERGSAEAPVGIAGPSP